MSDIEDIKRLLFAMCEGFGYEVTALNNQLAPPQNAVDYKVTKRQAPKKKRAAKENKYTTSFEEIWSSKPEREGGNNKVDAWKAYNARITLRDGAEVEPVIREMEEGVKRYKAYCDAAGITGTRHVKQLSTFLGPSRHYLEEWKLPTVETQKLTVPREHAKMEAFAREHGLTNPAPRGMLYPQYAELLEQELKDKVNKL